MESLAVLCVPQITANFPEIRSHGLFATGGVDLRCEVLLIRSDVLQIGLAGFH